MMYELYNGHGNYFFGSFMMILFWVLLVLLIAWIVKEVQGKNLKQNNSIEILKGRYAKGEIDKTEFEEKKKDLS